MISVETRLLYLKNARKPKCLCFVLVLFELADTMIELEIIIRKEKK